MLKHLHEQQQYLAELRQRKSQEIKARGENAIKQAGLRATAQIAKAADVVQITRGRYKHHMAKVNLTAEENNLILNTSTNIEK